MLTSEILQNKGYREYHKSPLENEGVERVWQKCFSDETGKKYFMNVKKWKDMRHPATGETIVGGYEFETQLYQKGSHNAFNLLFLSPCTLDEAEEFVEFLFQTGRLDYYELYDT